MITAEPFARTPNHCLFLGFGWKVHSVHFLRLLNVGCCPSRLLIFCDCLLCGTRLSVYVYTYRSV